MADAAHPHADFLRRAEQHIAVCKSMEAMGVSALMLEEALNIIHPERQPKPKGIEIHFVPKKAIARELHEKATAQGIRAGLLYAGQGYSPDRNLNTRKAIDSGDLDIVYVNIDMVVGWRCKNKGAFVTFHPEFPLDEMMRDQARARITPL